MLTGRFFLCGRCRSQVTICRNCDRDNAIAAMTAPVLPAARAGRRYQRSRRGRLAHATRARRYRARHNNVTHHSPPACPVGSLLRRPADDVVVAPTDVGERATTSIMPMPSCRFCRCRLSLFLRTGFVRRRGPRHAHPYGGRDPTDDRYPELEAQILRLITSRNGAAAPLRSSCTFITRPCIAS